MATVDHGTRVQEEHLLAYFLTSTNKKQDLIRIAAVVHPHEFYDPWHSDVFTTMIDLAANRDDDSWCNYLIVAEHLSDNPVIASRRWDLNDYYPHYVALADVHHCTFSIEEAHRLAITIRDTAHQRILRSAMLSAMEAQTAEDFHNAIDELRSRMAGYARPGVGEISTVWDGLEQWKEDCQRADAGAAITTGWRTIDRDFGAVRAGEVVIGAARAGVGKTWGGTSVGIHNATHGRKVLICTMEMTTGEVTERIVAQSLTMKPAAMRLSHTKLHVNDAREHLPHLDNLRIYDKPMSINQLGTVIRQCQATGFDPDLVVIDYMGLIVWEGNKNSMQYERSSEIARTLKTQAKKMGVAIFCLAQLNREAGDGTEEPFMHQLRDSGAIEEAADRILMFWKRGKDVYCKIAKNRHGEEGACVLLKYNDGMLLEEAAHR